MLGIEILLQPAPGVLQDPGHRRQDLNYGSADSCR